MERSLAHSRFRHTTVCAGAIRGGSTVSRGNRDRRKRLTPPPHTQSPRKAHATTITLTPPELTRNQIQSLKESKAYKQWLKFAKQAGKVGGIGLGIFLELADPAEAGDPDLDTIDLGQRKTE